MLHRCRPSIDQDKLIQELSNFDNITGYETSEFEAEFSKYVGSHTSIATDKGRSAIYLTIKMLNLKKGDEVIIQSFTCKTAVNPIIQAGATIRLVDIDENFNMPNKNLRKNISKKTRAIVATHLYGVPCNIEEISSIAKENNCILIEDSCQSLGSSTNGKKVGTIGDVAVFSFNVDKPIALGEGGMITINNENLINETSKQRKLYKKTPPNKDRNIINALLTYHTLTSRQNYNHDLTIQTAKDLTSQNEIKKLFNALPQETDKTRFQSDLLNLLKKPFSQRIRLLDKIRAGLNLIKTEHINDEMFMNSYRAKIGSTQLKLYDAEAHQRNQTANKYKKLIDDNGSFKHPTIDEKTNPNFLRYTLINKTKHTVQEISKKAREKGYEIGNYNWSNPIHTKYPYNNIIPHNKEDLQTSKYLADHIINLPVHTYVEDEDITNISELLNNINK